MEGVEEHGGLAGLEAWRRLHSDQRGTKDQRTEELRNLVIYPKRVAMSDVVTAVTKWERAYSDLVELCEGNFKLDDKGK